MADSGDIKTFNAAQGIAKERDLKLILWHSDAMRQTRTGDIPNSEAPIVDDIQRKYNQIKGLGLVISAQEELISTFRAQIKYRSLQKWRKKFKTDEEQEANKFEDFDCDYNKIRELEGILNSYRMAIIYAEKTKTLDDDFIIERIDSEGNTICELTENFWEMTKELTDSFEEIHFLLLVNKCISAGIEEDEELTYKEKEQEMIRRIVEA